MGSNHRRSFSINLQIIAFDRLAIFFLFYVYLNVKTSDQRKIIFYKKQTVKLLKQISKCVGTLFEKSLLLKSKKVLFQTLNL
jgi:hypothetical protein